MGATYVCYTEKFSPFEGLCFKHLITRYSKATGRYLRAAGFSLDQNYASVVNWEELSTFL